MASVTITYKTIFSSGAHQRQPRMGSTSGFTTVATVLLPNIMINPYTPPPPSQWLDTNNYTLLFMSATGGTQPTDVLNAIFPVKIGMEPIYILLVYAPNNGPIVPGENSCVTIDAFDSETRNLIDNTFGSLIDNNFVSQLIPGSDPMWLLNANQQGYVDTTNSGYQIVAYAPNIGAGDISATAQNDPQSAIFQKWVVSPNSSGISASGSSPTLTVPKGGSCYALAIYKVTKPSKETKDGKEKENAGHKDHKDSFKDKEVAKDIKEALDHPGKWGPDSQHGQQDQIGNPTGAGDPLLRALIQKTDALEAKLSMVLKGKAFIKQADRPVVGKPPKKKK